MVGRLIQKQNIRITEQCLRREALSPSRCRSCTVCRRAVVEMPTFKSCSASDSAFQPSPHLSKFRFQFADPIPSPLVELLLQ